MGFRQNDNAFLAVSDPEALQAAAYRFTSVVIRKRLEYWTPLLGPNFSKGERAAMNLRRFFAVSQIEYCRNFIFKRNFPPSRPVEFHHQPLTDPYVNLSIHTARHSHAFASYENKLSPEEEAHPGHPVGLTLLWTALSPLLYTHYRHFNAHTG